MSAGYCSTLAAHLYVCYPEHFFKKYYILANILSKIKQILYKNLPQKSLLDTHILHIAFAFIVNRQTRQTLFYNM